MCACACVCVRVCVCVCVCVWHMINIYWEGIQCLPSSGVRHTWVCVCPGGQCTQLGNIFSCGDMQKPHSMLNMYINVDVYYYHYNCNFINYSNIAITLIKMGLYDPIGVLVIYP